MSTHLEIFHSNRLGNHIHDLFVLTFPCSCHLGLWFLAYFSIDYELSRAIWPIDGKLTGMGTLGQSGPESYTKKGVDFTRQISRTRVSKSDVV